MNKQQRQQWRCDVCHVRTFPTFEEACAHEEVCRRAGSRSCQEEGEHQQAAAPPTNNTPPLQQQQEEEERDNTPKIPNPPAAAATAISEKPLHPFFVAKPAKDASHPEKDNRKKNNKTTSKSSSSSTKKKDVTATASAASASQPNNNKTKKNQKKAPSSSKRKTTASSTTVASSAIPSGNTWLSARSSQRPRRAASKQQQYKEVEEEDDDGNGNEEAEEREVVVAQPPKKKKSQKQPATTTSTTNATKNGKKRKTERANNNNKNKLQPQLAPIFVAAAAAGLGNSNGNSDDPQIAAQKLLNEQRALEFFAQRRHRQQQQQQQKSASRKKTAADSDDHDDGTDTMEIREKDTTTTTTSSSTRIAKSKKSASSMSSKQNVMAAPRFPNPSHVVLPDWKDTAATCDGDASNIHRSTWKPKQRRPTMAVFHNNNSILPDTTTTESSYADLFPNSSSESFLMAASQTATVEGGGDYDVLQRALSSVLVPPPPTATRKENKKDAHKLWVDRYHHHHEGDPAADAPNHHGDARTTSGASSYLAAQRQLTDFVERFMLERQKAEQRMAERQRRMRDQTKNNKKKRKKKASYCEDDLWEDSDAEDQLEAASSLCVLTGPVGCGKSQLVHDVAAKVGCRKVLELHPGHKRGAATMKRYIEEATKSHSTLDMLQNKKQKNASTAAFFQRRQELVDSGDESKDGAEAEGKGSAVTVILIDEVDNIFAEYGDNGFWTALSELYKRSKCPIILTANTTPKILYSSVFRFTHIQTDRPTLKECVQQMRNIIAAENFTYRNEKSSHQELERIAALGDCDLRRIVNAMQLSSLERPIIAPASVEMPEEESSSMTLPPPILIDSVTPASVHSCEYTLLTIVGTNFASLVTDTPCDGSGFPCKVFVGDELCPEARVLDDSTVLAVCGPRHLPPMLDQSGMYCGTRQRSVSAAYAQVRVCGAYEIGNVSSSDGAVLSTCLADGARVTVAPKPWLLEIHFPGYIDILNPDDREANADSDREEFEFASDQVKTTIEPRCKNTDGSTATPPLSPEITPRRASELLKEGIEAWASLHGPIRSLETDAVSKTCQMEILRTIDEASLCCHNRSDAAFLEDGLCGVPYLAGASRGFGFELTNEFPKRTNENSKPPHGDRLFSEGWNEYSYFYGNQEGFVKASVGHRECTLLKRSERSARGLSLPTSVSENGETEDDAEALEVGANTSDEDQLLPNPCPGILRELPSCLDSCMHVYFDKKDVLFERRLAKTAEAGMDLLCDYIFTGQPGTQMFFRSMTRALDPILRTSEKLESLLFLDYLPMLRSMAVQERVAESVFQATRKSQDPDGAKSNRKHSTRLAKRLGRKQYFEENIPAFVWRQSDKTPREIVELLASSALINE